MTAQQQASLAQAMDLLTAAYPDLSPRALLEGPVAHYALGPLPPYSGLKTHKIANVATATVGAFVLCYGYDRQWRDYGVLLIRRGESDAAGNALYGAVGGYIVIDPPSGEQPRQGAVRETGEETVDDKGKPVIDLTPERLRILDDGVDYRAAQKGGLPVHYTAFSARLAATEITRARHHAQRMEEDAAYRAAVTAHSKGEVRNVLWLRLSQAAALSSAQFTHPHELAALRLLARAVNARRDLRLG